MPSISYLKHFNIDKKGFTLIELLVVISIISLLIAILLPSLAKARQAAKKILCAAQQRQLGTAMYLYGNDNQGQLPAHYWNPNEPWFKNLQTYYNKDTRLLACPTVPLPPQNSTHYAYNLNLNSLPSNPGNPGATSPNKGGLNIVDIKASTLVVALMDVQTTKVGWGDFNNANTHSINSSISFILNVDYRHDQVSNFLFVDGHVTAIKDALTNYNTLLVDGLTSGSN